MTTSRNPALVIAPHGSPGLLGSYGRALAKHMEVVYWDLRSAVERNVKYPRFGRTLSAYLPFEPWVLAANRELIKEARRTSPRLILIAGAMPFRAGALAQIKTSCPGTSLVLLWPDSLLNLNHQVILSLPLFDLVGSYSKEAIPMLEKFGAPKVEFLPFGADLELFPSEVDLSPRDARQLESDVCFVGNHRPEREEAVLKLIDAGIRVKVWGEDNWLRRSSSRGRASSYFQGKPLFGKDLVRAVRASKMSLNVIDPTNYPAANMRFFESLACKRVSLTSPCPELYADFPDRHSCVYFELETLVDTARELMNNPVLGDQIAERAWNQLLAGHTYEHRAKRLLEILQV